jgi:NAD(P)H-hydrate repair Nnr-like enzyme with NAD(P)H-hydrate dehydratase domain
MAMAGLAIGYVMGAVLGGLAVSGLSPNRHDRSQEAAMTGAFVTGPIGGLAGAIALMVRSRRRRP